MFLIERVLPIMWEYHSNPNLSSCMSIIFAIRSVAVDNPRKIKELTQKFFALYPSIMQDFIESQSYYMNLESVDFALEETHAHFAVLGSVREDDPLRELKIQSINECWEEFRILLELHLKARKSQRHSMG